ncbi:recombinase family protein [Rathayibacter sp. Leaf248]|jgi:DNA invertase Pin-like site-specific DNA recombinase|uniref:recombinase family protein n=1 Tax=Rathayibacter sp. Leaf248 TaxID=2876555 RepID=UPI001E54332D|nr:recombinase family protein [Rathayibacter sp. Leaf248]
MPLPRAAAIYARISSDPTGQALGVQRQLEDCRKLAEERGWRVATEYVDNDISAYSGKTRPDYERMLSDIGAGLLDAVIVYNLDRLTRRPIELEQFREVCDRAGVRNVATVSADLDLGTEDGLLMARVVAAFAAKESARKSERVKRKIQQNVEAGKPNGGPIRPFGYEPDKITVRESEAEVIREIVPRFLAGESVRSLALWLNGRGIPTTGNAEEWRTPTLRALLTSGRIAGMRDHHGVAAAKAVWPAIITDEEHRQILAVFASKKVSGRRSPRRYLLSGLLRCGKCGNRLFSSPRATTRRYVCSPGPDHGGCGKLTVVAAPVEEWIAAAVLLRLDTPAMADVLAGRVQADERRAGIVAELETLQSRMLELGQMFAAGDVSRPEWKAARDSLEARATTAQRRLDQIVGTGTVDSLIGSGSSLRAQWAELNLERQVQIIRSVLDYATILPGTPGARSLDPSRIVPTWQL